MKLNLPRKFHFAFGWCKVFPGTTGAGKKLVELEADEISYYVMGKGYTVSRRQNGTHPLVTPEDELLESDETPLSPQLALKKTALNPTITFYKKTI